MRYFPVEDSIHLRWASSNVNGLGVSPLKALATTIKLDDSARTFQQSSFANGAQPGSMIVPPENFTYKAHQKEELREDIKRRFGGSKGAFDVALLAPGFDWKSIAFSPRDSEIVAARQINREEIAMVYDLSGPMINDLEHGTYSNVAELGRMLYVTTLRPVIRRIEETLNAQLIDCEEEWAGEKLFIEADLSEVLRGNRREEIDAASEAYTNGLLTLNECRAILGLPRIDHELADMPFVAANNMKTLDQMGAEDQAGLTPNGGEQTPIEGELPNPNPGHLSPPRKAAPLPEG
jgi:HK97 family phage portal protein